MHLQVPAARYISSFTPMLPSVALHMLASASGAFLPGAAAQVSDFDPARTIV